MRRPSRLDFLENAMPEASFVVRIRSQLLPTLTQMHNAATGGTPRTLSSYLSELLEIAIIEVRRLKIMERDMRPGVGPPNLKQPSYKIPKMKAETVQKIIYLFRSEHVSVEEIGKRFNLSATSVKRLLRIHD
jgi:hypothetical protein